MDLPSVVGSAMALLLASVATPTASPTAYEPALPPIVWELSALSPSSGDAANVDPSELYTVQFLPGEQVAIRADCNRGSGSFASEDAVLHFTSVATTMALCPGESLGQPFLMLFDGDVQFAYDEDGSLTLDGAHGSAVLQPSLHGVVWEWQRFMSSDDSLREPDAPDHYTIEFLADGEFAVRADCNRGRGTYVVDRPQIDMTVGPTTRAICPPESQSDPFLKDIDAFSSFVFRDGNLYFALPVDAGISEFSATLLPAPSAATEAG